MASSIGHFPDPLHLTMLLLQLLKGINNIQKVIHNNQHYVSISALVFHIYTKGVTGGTDQTSGGCSLC
jgi:hypothetical protein